MKRGALVGEMHTCFNINLQCREMAGKDEKDGGEDARVECIFVRILRGK